ncbi:methane monooxygenase PmoA-like [Kribbella antiqua]|uniref:Methane monooxygenase PmoA-like n=1 Tax=Kribbella antiqua TaxID=2512217 RepID=A0A4R2IET2_9ACTN|nr:PmoA family protein [Kribbella antiqua]TCO42299.1 methane monooxygenase PmoA-like [Kribbella antiqua]
MTESAADLVVEGRTLARYVWEPDLPLAYAPRPYLHPVTTPAGTVVTELMPASHRHHAGVSIAVPDVDGANFWGGRTYIAGHGPAWLDNQGIQRHERWLEQRPSQLAHAVRWSSPAGETLLTEERVLTARGATDTAWVLGLSFALTNATDRPLEIRSPAAAGRTGAGYGGFFWRAPGSNRVFGPAGVGLDAVHGQTCDWIAVTGAAWTLVFTAADDVTRADPWFVRTRDYTGVGSALSWDVPLTLPPGGTAVRSIATVVADGELSDDEAAELVDLTRTAR